MLTHGEDSISSPYGRRYAAYHHNVSYHNMKKKLSDIELHSAGATVKHKSVFNELDTYANKVEIDQEFRDKWVMPFYFNLSKNEEEWINQILQLKDEISDEIILKNLGDFNWRTRSTGAFFAAIKNKQEFTEIIGNHLLKSEVCFAGRQYAVTLASFNSSQSIAYLNKYLDYYLLQLDLQFDQIPVARSVKYLDEINKTNYFQKHKQNLIAYQEYQSQKTEAAIKKFTKEGAKGMANAFEGHKEFWNQELDIEPIRISIETINKIR